MEIGQITLNVSFVLYLFYLVPQIIHNFRDGQIKKLSLLMHSILLLAYIFDLVYGCGRKMEWQYIAVSLVGLFCLLIQHFQIIVNYQFEGFEKRFFGTFTVFAYLIIFMSVYLIFAESLSKSFLITLGGISQLGWLTYAIPQIVKNYNLKSAKGLSIFFIIFVSLITFCDVISAWSLNWDLPNKIGSPISLLMKLTLLTQFFLYSNKALPRSKRQNKE
ncbi:MAG: PQ-loop repeat-containing protein [Candidatus Caenarcaniphilales bacterium]|nr:PQ-loop repeat-containing protein [Candidatus Caenarcaniphilales bacterium]